MNQMFSYYFKSASVSLLFFLLLQNIFAATTNDDDPKSYTNSIVKPTIHTVQIHPKGLDLGYPIIELNGENKLELSFDELTEETHNYSYQLIHCNAKWTPSNLSEFDYLEGFAENQISDYHLSFNTNIEYIHYKVSFPNEDIKLKISGNYIIQVFQDFDKEKIVLSQRFMVVEPHVEIKGVVKYPINLDLRKTHQEVDFSIFHENFQIDNHQIDLKVVLTQNDRWDNSQRFLKPLFIRKNELVFDYDSENVFPGANEFRYFDIKSLSFQSRFIKNIVKRNSDSYVELFPDENKHFKSYIFEHDLNGKYMISVEKRDNPATDADYAWVKFTLPMETPITNGNFYIYGKFSGWKCNKFNVMKYSLENKSYELTLLLKQGYYNYQYAFLEKGNNIPDITLIEGSHYETENDYVIYVYYRDLVKNYDRLIGWQVINSLKRIY